MKTVHMNSREEMEELILACPYCMAGLTDDAGHPYVIPLNFG